MVVEILEFELALGDFGTWPRRVTLEPTLSGVNSSCAHKDKDSLFKQFLGV